MSSLRIAQGGVGLAAVVDLLCREAIVKLQHIPVPVWTPPAQGPWRISATRPDGTSGGVTRCTWNDRADAIHVAAIVQRNCREGCTYDVVPVRGES